MKIEYNSINDDIEDAIKIANKEGRTIKQILMNQDEWHEYFTFNFLQLNSDYFVNNTPKNGNILAYYKGIPLIGDWI